MRYFFSSGGSGLNNLVSFFCVFLGKLLMFVFIIDNMVYLGVLLGVVDKFRGFWVSVKWVLGCNVCIVLWVCYSLLWVLLVFRCNWV